MANLRTMKSTLATAVCASAAIALATPAFAQGPQNCEVTHGNVVITQNGNVFLIEASDGAVLSCQGFDIAASEIVQFLQPSELARVLTQVTGGSRSDIEGALLSNGFVFIANPAGIFFGGNVVVNVGGIYAAAGTISGDHFNAAEGLADAVFQFTMSEIDGEGEVTVAEGALIEAARAVHLIGRQIENNGTIRVENGVITMLAGNTVTVSEIGNPVSVEFEIEAGNPGDVDGHGVWNGEPGSLEGSGTRVVLGAGDMYSLAAVRHSGTIDAGSVEMFVGSDVGDGVNAEGGIQLDSDVKTTGDQTYDDSVIIGDNITLAASDVLFQDTVDALVAGNQSLNIDGNVQFEGAVGSDDALKSLEVSGATAINGGSVMTKDHQTYTGAVTLGADTTLTSTDGDLIKFGAAVDGVTNGGQFLHIEGAAEFDGAVGATKKLQNLEVSGATAINGGSVTTDDHQTYTGAVTLGADTTLTSTDGDLIKFKSTVDGAGNGTEFLHIEGDAEFDGAVGATKKLQNLEVSGATAINGGSVTTEDHQTYTGAVDFGAGDITLDAGTDITFDSTITGNASLTVDAGENAIFNGAIDALEGLFVFAGEDATFRGDIGANTMLGTGGFRVIAGGLTTFDDPHFEIHTAGDVVFGEALADTPVSATIQSTGHLSVFSANFFMGQHQKLIVLGDLLIDLFNSCVELSSITAESITVSNADSIIIDAADSEVQITANSIDFNVVPEVNGDVQFATLNGAGDVRGTLQGFPMRTFGPGALFSGVLGATNTDIAETFAADAPRDSQKLDADEITVLDTDARNDLSEIFELPSREQTRRELVQLTEGRVVWDDVGATRAFILTGAGEQIVATRFDPAAARAALEAYEACLDVRTRLDESWRTYQVLQNAVNATTDASGFVAHLGDSGNGQVLMDLAAISDLLVRVRRLGPTEYELSGSIEFVRNLFRPDNMNDQVFVAALEVASQMVRGG